jgi:hypothetical protein
MPRPLAQQQYHAPGRRVNQNRLAGTDGPNPAQQHMHGQAPQHAAGRDIERNPRRQRHDTIGRNGPAFTITAQCRGIGHPITGLKIGHARASGHDDTSTLHPQDGRKTGTSAQAGAEIDIDVIDANRLLPDQDLPGRERA